VSASGDEWIQTASRRGSSKEDAAMRTKANLETDRNVHPAPSCSKMRQSVGKASPWQSRYAKTICVTAILLIVAGLLSAAPADHAPKVERLAAKSAPAKKVGASQQREITARFGLLPLSFEANLGQADSQTQYTARGPGYSLNLTEDEAVVTLQRMDQRKRNRFETRKYFLASPRFHHAQRPETVRIGLAGASPNPQIEHLDELPGKSNYFIGNDPRAWRTGVPSYGKVKYAGIYPGIDLVFYGDQQQLEFDFIVAPGGDPRAIALRVGTKGRISITHDGDLQVKTSNGSLDLRRPTIYQISKGERQRIEGGFVLLSENRVGIHLAEYDRSKQLVVDPVLSYSTYLGGNGVDWSDGIAVDALGNAYIVGSTTSTNFPIANGYPSSANPSGGIAFLAKLNPTGTTLLYSTHLGGTGGEWTAGIALDPPATPTSLELPSHRTSPSSTASRLRLERQTETVSSRE